MNRPRRYHFVAYHNAWGSYCVALRGPWAERGLRFQNQSHAAVWLLAVAAVLGALGYGSWLIATRGFKTPFPPPPVSLPDTSDIKMRDGGYIDQHGEWRRVPGMVDVRVSCEAVIKSGPRAGLRCSNHARDGQTTCGQHVRASGPLPKHIDNALTRD